MEKITSKFMALDMKDFLKGLLVSAGSAIVTTIQNMISSGSIDWKAIGSVALAAGVAYLVKNFFTDSHVMVPVTKTETTTTATVESTTVVEAKTKPDSE